MASYAISVMHISIGLQSLTKLKSPKTECSNPHQDLGPIKIQFWWSHVPLFLQYCGQVCHCFPTKFKPKISAKHSHVDDSIQEVSGHTYTIYMSE